jgi:AraC-like DNA-binding protein/quercetin dioxygenase-like cupin family protein
MVERTRHGGDATGTVSTVRVEGGAAATPWHSHRSLIPGRIDSGARTLQLPAGDVALDPGDGFVIPPGTPHAWAAASVGTHRIVALDPKTFRLTAWRPGAIRDAAWGGAFDALHARAEAGEAELRAGVEDLLAHTARHAAPAGERPAVAKPLRMARREVSCSLEQTLDLAELARRVGLSPFHLHRLYRRTWGLTPAEHRVEARLRHARGLILAGATVAEAAAATGFADQSHFTRVFRRLMGVPPGVWARQRRTPRRRQAQR